MLDEDQGRHGSAPTTPSPNSYSSNETPPPGYTLIKTVLQTDKGEDGPERQPTRALYN